jgi:hypothetical protein
LHRRWLPALVSSLAFWWRGLAEILLFLRVKDSESLVVENNVLEREVVVRAIHYSSKFVGREGTRELMDEHSI